MRNLMGYLVLATAILLLPRLSGAFDVPRADQTPNIDGVPDDPAWSAAEWVELKHLITGSMPDPEDFSARYKLVWTPEHLYLLAEITDDILHDSHPNPLEQYWDDDALEIFIDEDASGGLHQFDYNAFAYHIALDNQAVDIGPWLTEQDEKAGNINFRLYPHHISAQWKRSSENPFHLYWEVKITVYGDDYRDFYPPNVTPARPVILTSGKELGFMLAYCDSDGENVDHGREHFVGDILIEPVNGDRNRGYIDASVFGEIVLD